ncbi:MAG: peptide deformylase [Candidatus Aureabacteria bacterium]|nr:peptide deformylase [Candidatus Auribacterota bacterium]
MAILPVRIYGHKVLRQKAAPVERMSDEIKRLILDLKDSLYYHQGVGIAANQIGIPCRVFLARDGKAIKAFLNPKIVRTEGTMNAEEGCLSFPEIYAEIERSAQVTLEYLDEDFSPRKIDAEGTSHHFSEQFKHTGSYFSRAS